MKKHLKILFLIISTCSLFFLNGCKKEIPLVEIEYTFQDSISIEQIIEEYSSISGLKKMDKDEVEITTNSLEIVEILNDKIHLKNIGSAILEISSKKFTGNIKLIIKPEMIVKASDTMKVGGAQSVSVKFLPNTYSEEYTITSSNESIASIYSTNKIKGLKSGTTTIKVVSVSGIEFEYELTVVEPIYKISYIIEEEDMQYLKGELVSEYSVSDLPLTLPTIEKNGYAFYGWQINPIGDFYVEEDLVYELPQNYKNNVVLKPILEKSSLELRHESTSVIEPNEELEISLELVNVPSKLRNVVWESLNINVATVDQEGKVTGIKDGTAEIFAYLKDMPEVNMSIIVSVQTGVNDMNDLLEYFKTLAFNEILTKRITVTAYQGDYKTYIYSGVSYYLFEELNIIEQMTSENMSNRPGDIYEKHYITVHDTASGASSANAKAHANYVNDGGEGTSWHYTVGNDGIYHQIPDNENAYHAGDGGRDYKEIDTGIKADPTNPYPVVTISKDGYYEIAGQKTSLVAPLSRPKKCPNGACGTDTKDGEVACSKCGKKFEVSICTNDMINTHGIRTGILDNGNYYIGNTYFNTTYRYISNAGGNDNAIGIEMCVNQGSDIFYTWQRNAKLVAKLLAENNLTINDVKPHHFFSGKDCPATMLHAEMWDLFIKMVEVEHTILTKYSDYKITFKSNNENFLGNNGKILKQASISKSVSYTITVEKDGVSESITLSTVIPSRLLTK